jgi:hypothetical protein
VTVAGEPRPRSRWPLALLSVLLVLLAVVVVATAQLYWTNLRSGVAQMRASIAAAQEQQRQLIERVRAAEAALAKRTAAQHAPGAATSVPPTSVPPKSVPDCGGAAAPRATSAPPLREALPPDERGRLAAWLQVLALDATRLRSARAPGPRLSPPGPARQLLREQLAIAAAAAATGDVQLLDATLLAAERLTGPPHRGADAAGAALAQRLAEVRERLRVAAGAGTPAAAAPARARD